MGVSREKTTGEPENRREEQDVELEGEEEQVGAEEQSQLYTEHQLGDLDKAKEHQQGLDNKAKEHQQGLDNKAKEHQLGDLDNNKGQPLKEINTVLRVKSVRFHPEIGVCWTRRGAHRRFSPCMATIAQAARFDSEGRNRRSAPYGRYAVNGISYRAELANWEVYLRRTVEGEERSFLSGGRYRYYHDDVVAVREYSGQLAITYLPPAAKFEEFYGDGTFDVSQASAEQVREYKAHVSAFIEERSDAADNFEDAYLVATVPGLADSDPDPIVPPIDEAQRGTGTSNETAVLGKRSHDQPVEQHDAGSSKQQRMNPGVEEAPDSASNANDVQINLTSTPSTTSAVVYNNNEDQWVVNYKMISKLYKEGVEIEFVPELGGEQSPLGRLPGNVTVTLECGGPGEASKRVVASATLSLEDVQSKWKAFVPFEAMDLRLERGEYITLSCVVCVPDVEYI